MVNLLKFILPLAAAVWTVKLVKDGWRVRARATGGYVIWKESSAGDRAHL